MNEASRQYLYDTAEMPGSKTTAASVTGAYSMQVYDHVVRIDAGSSFTVKLPGVAEARGRVYSVNLASLGGAFAATLTDAGDDSAFADVVLNAVNEGVVLFSDGYRWWTLASTVV